MLLSLHYVKTRPLELNSMISFSVLGRFCAILQLFFVCYGLTHYNIYTNKSKYQYKRQFNEAQKMVNQQNCRTTITNFSNYASTVSMESPFEILERHDDHAHSHETSCEKLVLPKQTQNEGPLLRNALGD